jgi:GT2 family glycosyltransferase
LNVGFAVACNFGASISRGKRILFINPDVGNLNLKDFKNAFDSMRPIVFLGSREGKSVWTNRSPVPSLHKIMASFTRNLRSETFYMDGSFMLISKGAFFDVGGFDDFFLYGEDLFLFKKLIKRDSDIVFFGDGSSFVHFRGSSTKRRHKFIDSKFYAELKYLKENSNILTFNLYGILRILVLSLILMRDIMKRPTSIVFLLRKYYSILKIFFLLNFKSRLDSYHSNLKLI